MSSFVSDEIGAISAAVVGESARSTSGVVDTDCKSDEDSSGNWDDSDYELPDVELSLEKSVLSDSSTKAQVVAATKSSCANGQDDWLTVAQPSVLSPAAATAPDRARSYLKMKDYDDPIGEPPMLLVNLTVLSGGAVHNKHDAHSVNDPDKKKVMCDEITSQFSSYRDNGGLLASGTIRPCGQSVWTAALAELRRDHPGQFWAPIFPPKQK